MTLHWILALTVTLLHCLTAQPIPAEYSEIETGIEVLKENGCQEPDSQFYCPSGTDVCTIKALDCSIQELEKVRTECFEENTRNTQLLNRTRDSITLMLKEMNITLQADSKNCFCEGETPVEKSYNEFLDNILTLLQRLNSR